jgi:hypothetical protein
MSARAGFAVGPRRENELGRGEDLSLARVFFFFSFLIAFLKF